MVGQSHKYRSGQQFRCIYTGWCGNCNHYRNLNAGLNQIWFCDGDGNRSHFDHFGFRGLLSDINPDESNVYLYAHGVGHWKLQFCGYVVCQPGWHRRCERKRRIHAGSCGDRYLDSDINAGLDQIWRGNGYRSSTSCCIC